MTISKKCLDRALDIVLTVFLLGWLLVALAFGLRIFVADKFRIPSGSMTPTAIPGDYIVVNKLLFGARIYKNLDFLEGAPMQSWRVKGLRGIRVNDIVVFNYPLPRNDHTIAFTIETVYMKRCVGLPGDTIGVRRSFFYNTSAVGPVGYIPGQQALANTDSASFNQGALRPGYLRRGRGVEPWSLYNMGPLHVPREGSAVRLDTTNYRLYAKAVEYETGKKLRLDGDTLRLDGEYIAAHTFRNNYYFMAGDNVSDSRDSRYWGFVPEDFIVGVATHVLYSYDRDIRKFRWNRLMKRLK